MSSTPKNNPPKLPGVRFLGSPTYAHHGPQAALLRHPVASDVLQAAYKRLPPEARQNMALAKRWGHFAVLATEKWAHACSRMVKPPRNEEEITEVAK